MSALRRLPIDVLKLDRGLVDGVAESARLHKITAGLLRIAGDLGMESVADGVDDPEQVRALMAMGCTHGQGAAFAGALDEHRLRHALDRGPFPVPGTLSNALPGDPTDGGNQVLVGGALPVRSGVVGGAGALAHAPLRSNNETPVPPT